MGEQPGKAKTKHRPAWLTGSDGPPRAARAGRGAGPLATDGADPSRERGEEPVGLAREYLGRVDLRQAADDPRATGRAPGRGGLAGAWGWIAGNRAPLAAAGVILILAVVGLRACAGGGDAPAGQAQDPAREPSRQTDPGEVQDTGLVFSALEKEDGRASLEAGELRWDGQVATGEGGETVTLQGPTAAQIDRGFRLPRSSVESGTFAVAQDDGPVIHVDTHTFRAGEDEVTLGSLFAIEDDVLEDYGFYLDERREGSEEVVRTYFDPAGNASYAVSFATPEGTPVPLLVGWRGPSEGPGSEG